MNSTATDLLRRGVHQLQRGKLDQAQSLFKKVLVLDPLCFDAHYYLAVIAHGKQEYVRAITCFRLALSINQSDPVLLSNMGLTYLAIGDLEGALSALNKSIELDSKYSLAWFNRANVNRQLKQLDAAVLDFKEALSLEPFNADALNNLGSTLRELGDLAGSESCLQDCLKIKPDYHFALNNLAMTRQARGDSDGALALLEQAVAIEPNYVEAHVNLGNLLQDRQDYLGACKHYKLAHRYAPGMRLLAGYLAQAMAMLCDWRGLRMLWKEVEQAVDRHDVPCTPFGLLTFCDDPARSLRLAKAYADQFVSSPARAFAYPKPSKSGRRLRIGYLSSDFREHPVAYLMVGILEHHNKSEFEVYGFALREPKQDSLGVRMSDAVEHFIDLSGATDAQAIDMIRACDLDIAIDLNGFIDGCRPAIFKSRVAPLQINYYGYPGTIGGDFMDYIVADLYLIPPELQAAYSEKIIYLPDCYQPNDDKRDIDQSLATRADFGLPERSFVFCCFNKPYKITQSIFTYWMDILLQVEGSVLWLQSADDTVIKNLRRFAQGSGVDAERLIFAGRTPTTAQHLSRYRLADLFLDTYPYTAHTTANDALWVGLPVLTLEGKTFSSRVSGSLLAALGVRDLIMATTADYVNMAVVLANNQELLANFRARIAQGKNLGSLYKPAQIAKWLEAGLREAHAQRQHGGQLNHIFVERH